MVAQHSASPHFSPMSVDVIKDPADERMYILRVFGNPTGPLFVWFDQTSLQALAIRIQNVTSGIVVPDSAKAVDWEQFLKDGS